MEGPSLKSPRVKQFLKSEIGAAVIWVLCALCMAAVLSPWFHLGGKYFAAVCAAVDFPAVLEWFGAACGRSDFDRFFNRALLFSALALLPFLLRRVKTLGSSNNSAPVNPISKISWRSAAAQIVAACIISAGMLWGVGILLEAAGAYMPKANAPSPGKFLSKVIVPAIGASLLEEWLFRGVVLGLWLRFSRPAMACLGTSVLFAFLHFLEPPANTIIADPGDPLAGFQLLGKILLHFTEPLFFVTDFATLLAVGLILAWARIRTGALWFSIGLHAGWIMAFKGYHMLFERVADHPLRPWAVGESLRSGILPFFTLGITAVICHFALRRFTVAGCVADPQCRIIK